MLIRVIRTGCFNLDVPDNITKEQLDALTTVGSDLSANEAWDKYIEPLIADEVEDSWHFIPTPGNSDDETTVARLFTSPTYWEK